MSASGISRSRATEILDEAIQEHDADVERNLLAGDGVEESFENGGIARRLESGECGDERAEWFVLCGEGIEVAEIDAEAEHAVEFGAKSGFDFGGAVRRFQLDAQARMRGRADLLDGEFDDARAGFRFEEEGAAINLTVPAVENVFRAAA